MKKKRLSKKALQIIINNLKVCCTRTRTEVLDSLNPKDRAKALKVLENN